MNKYNAKDYLPLVQAWAEGKAIQVWTGGMNISRLNNPQHWQEVCYIAFDDANDANIGEFRIKPEPKKEWVRVGLWTAEGILHRCYANSLSQETAFEGRTYFGGWLTDRIEYELPEAK